MKKSLYAVIIFVLGIASQKASAQEVLLPNGWTADLISVGELLPPDSPATYLNICAAAYDKGYGLWPNDVNHLYLGENLFKEGVMDVHDTAYTPTDGASAWHSNIYNGKEVMSRIFIARGDSIKGVTFYEESTKKAYLPWADCNVPLDETYRYPKQTKFLFRKL